MADMLETRRVAVVARGEQATALHDLFRSAPLRAWEVFLADSCEHAHFLVQMDACDALLADQSILDSDRTSLGWLTTCSEVPILFVSEAEPDVIATALRQGARQWLPRPMTLAHPAVLAAALQHAVLDRATVQRTRRTDAQLRDCRSQVTRLVNLLWDTIPAEGRPGWFSQRYMLERLQEEVCRSERHGNLLSVVLGEVWIGQEDGALAGRRPLCGEEGMPGQLSRWTAERINWSKRRCDVAGQYGPHGFMLLLPHTPPEGAVHFCRRLQRLLEDIPPSEVSSPRLEACFGIAGYSSESSSPKRLLRQAEEQLEQARAARAGDG
ncbi:MAG: diguanylate cyclase [Planctomycetes bacterium]|nr:diguanylate cyclase [Planctomycetota bacterium]